MTLFSRPLAAAILSIAVLVSASPGLAHKLRESGKTEAVAQSDMTVTPTLDWNRLDGRIGKRTETWTLDGEQLNNVTFFGGIAPGNPLIRERDRKNRPLPDFTSQTLLPEIPELLERTYRADSDIGTFSVLSVAPARFLAQDGVEFTYSYVDADGLTRLGLARAVIVQGDLFMMLYEAPRLHYYERNLPDFLALLESASLPG